MSEGVRVMNILAQRMGSTRQGTYGLPTGGRKSPMGVGICIDDHGKCLVKALHRPPWYSIWEISVRGLELALASKIMELKGKGSVRPVSVAPSGKCRFKQTTEPFKVISEAVTPEFWTGRGNGISVFPESIEPNHFEGPPPYANHGPRRAWPSATFHGIFRLF